MISVAVVTYNGEKYIEEQLDSIAVCLANEDEIVVSDDGSTDRTRDIVKNFEIKFPNIRLIDGPQKGVIANVENCIRACKGDYIFLADQDDIWMMDKVQKVMDAFEHRNAMLVMHDAHVVNDDMSEEVMPSFFAYRGSGKGAIKNFIKNTYMGCAMAFRKEVVDKVCPIPQNIQMHDQWIGIRCDMLYHRTVILKDKLLEYRRHDNNASDFGRNTPLVMVKNRMILLGELLKAMTRS